MPVHDRTGEPIEPLTAAEARERIRASLCLGPKKCRYDHEHTVPDEVPGRPIENVDPKEHL